MNSGYINLRGHETWSVEYANNGQPLVLLHGGLSSNEDWDSYILPSVEKTHHVYGYDRTGHGRTGIREGYFHFDFQCDEAIAYLEDVVKGPAHLVGWSDGGIIALWQNAKTLEVEISASGLAFTLKRRPFFRHAKMILDVQAGQNPLGRPFLFLRLQ